MSSQTYHASMTTAARLLVGQLMPLLTQADDLRVKINNPQCGKPGKGFKAMKKLQPQLQQLDVEIAGLHAAIAAFIRPSKKMSLASAAKRQAYIDAALREWNAWADWYDHIAPSN